MGDRIVTCDEQLLQNTEITNISIIKHVQLKVCLFKGVSYFLYYEKFKRNDETITIIKVINIVIKLLLLNVLKFKRNNETISIIIYTRTKAK